MKNGKTPEISLSPIEARTFKYGALRQTVAPSLVFDFQAHKADYNMMGVFVNDGIQAKMRDVYGLREVFIPEQEDMTEADEKDAKSNIFMTKDFHRPDAKQR